MEIEVIQNKIYEIRGRRVMFDSDIARMYGIETAQLKRAVRRNMKRFEGEDFMFEATRDECSRCQFGILNSDDPSRSQIVTLNKGRGSNIKYLPFVFTELGVAMLSSVLNSDTAIEVNRSIMRAFVALRELIATSVEIRQLALENAEIRLKLELLERNDEDTLEAMNDLSEDLRKDIDNLYNAIGELSVKPVNVDKPRRPIGYRVNRD